MKFNRRCIIILNIVLAMAMAIMSTGCGKDKKSKNPTADLEFSRAYYDVINEYAGVLKSSLKNPQSMKISNIGIEVSCTSGNSIPQTRQEVEAISKLDFTSGFDVIAIFFDYSAKNDSGETLESGTYVLYNTLIKMPCISDATVGCEKIIDMVNGKNGFASETEISGVWKNNSIMAYDVYCFMIDMEDYTAKGYSLE